MYNVLTLNKISSVGLEKFDSSKYTCGEVENPDAVILRSASMHDMDIPESVLAIARAGAGTNNIPIDKCSEKGIVVFNTPGANANAVKELVICGMLLASRKITNGIAWAKTLKGEGDAAAKKIEKGKGQFAGTEILGKTLGVIGFGAIGRKVAEAAKALGMNIVAYDNFLPDDAKFDGVEIVKTVDELYAVSDFVTIHIPLNDSTRGFFGKDAVAKCKEGVKVLNFARGGIVDNGAILEGIESGKVSAYVVDFPDDEVLDKEGVIAIPHLGASTAESEENCASMAAEQLVLYIETGSIKNSVNMVNVNLPTGTKTCVFCKDEVADEVKKLGKVIGEGSKKGYSYIALDGKVDVNIDGAIKTRVIG